MNPEQALEAIVKEQNIGVLIAEPRYLKALLMDYCLGADYPKEFNLLVVACNVRIPQALQRPISSTIEVDPVPGLARKMVNEHGISESLAQWTVEAWAKALGVNVPVVALQPTESTPAPEPSPELLPPSIRVNAGKPDVIALPDDRHVPLRRSRFWAGGLIIVGAVAAVLVVVIQRVVFGSPSVTDLQGTPTPQKASSARSVPIEPIAGLVTKDAVSASKKAASPPQGAVAIVDAPPDPRKIVPTQTIIVPTQIIGASEPPVTPMEQPREVQASTDLPNPPSPELQSSPQSQPQNPEPDRASQASLSARSPTPLATARISATPQPTSVPSRGGTASTPTTARTPPTQQPTSAQTGPQQPDEAIPPPEISAAPEPINPPKPTVAPEPTSAPKPTVAPEPTSAPQPTAPPEPTTTPQPTAPPEPTAVPTTAPTVGAVPTDTRAPSPSPAPTDTRVPSPSPAPTDTRVPTPTVAPTETRAPTPTTAPTNTRVPTQTPVPTATVDRSPTIAPTVQLSSPTLSSPSNGARIMKGQSATLTWSSVSRASGYQVEISNEDDPNAGGSFTVSGTSHTYTFGSGGFWNLRVRALGADGQLPGPPSPNVRIVVPY